jgi:coproporphyrinogen III oxidase-like Fe-S oxidoreductase
MSKKTITKEKKMSKYEKLWESLKSDGRENFNLSYQEIEDILGFSIDHSFLTYKKEAKSYGYEVGKISMKEKVVNFKKCID